MVCTLIPRSPASVSTSLGEYLQYLLVVIQLSIINYQFKKGWQAFGSFQPFYAFSNCD